MLNLKQQFYNKCVLIATQRISELKNIIQETQNAANNETKSSAGDKHETGRAMAQLETEKLNTQLGKALKLIEILNKINPKQKHQIIGLGSLVSTNNGNFFISISLGKIEIEKKNYYAISTISPIGKLLLTKKKAETFSFNNKTYIISSVI